MTASHIPLALLGAVLAAPAMALGLARVLSSRRGMDRKAQRRMDLRCAILCIISFLATTAAAACLRAAEGRFALPAVSAALVAGGAAMALAGPWIKAGHRTGRGGRGPGGGGGD